MSFPSTSSFGIANFHFRKLMVSACLGRANRQSHEQVDLFLEVQGKEIYMKCKLFPADVMLNLSSRGFASYRLSVRFHLVSVWTCAYVYIWGFRTPVLHGQMRALEECWKWATPILLWKYWQSPEMLECYPVTLSTWIYQFFIMTSF